MTHEELLELIPLAAIDALSAAERAAVRAHVATCSSCADRLAEYARVAAALLASAPTAIPPPSVEANLRARIQAASIPTRSTQGFWRRWFAWPRWALATAAVAALALVAFGVWMVAAPRAETTDAELASVLQTPGVVKVPIKGTDRAPEAMGQVVITPDASAGYLVVSHLAVLPSQQTYQVWLTRNGERDSGGTFSVNANGWAAFRLKAPRPFNSYQEIGVSVEPAGGSAWPTTNRVIGGLLAQR
ncbi:MAG: anti-sigma factor [Chloroflexota bacterium]